MTRIILAATPPARGTASKKVASDKDTFWQLVALGGELRQIHVLESRVVNQFITGYPLGGNNIVEKPVFKPGTQAPLPASVRMDANERGEDSTREMPASVPPEEPIACWGACVPVGECLYQRNPILLKRP